MRARCRRAAMNKFVMLRACLRKGFLLTSVAAVLVALASCGGTTVVERAEAEPHAHHESGTSLFVEAVETDGDLIKLDLLIINGTGGRISVADDNDPVVLQGKSGKQYPAAAEKITLDPYTSNKLKVSFAGPLAGDEQPLALRVNGKHGNRTSEPGLVVENIPVAENRLLEFAKFEPSRTRLPDTTFHHANGLTFTLKEIASEDNEARITFSAVNGHKEAVELVGSSSERGFMQDERGNRFYLVPSSSNPQLAIPAYQKLSGTLRFAGRVPPATKSLSLRLNDRFGGDADFSKSPKIVINNIPLR